MKDIQYIPAILLFGPSHGTCSKVVAGTPFVITIDSETPDYRPLRYNATPAELIASTKLHRHEYRYQDMMCSPHGEDVMIYVHNENCCEKVIPDDTDAAMRAMW